MGGLAAIAVWMFCAIVHPLEPRYGRKRLSDWADILALFWDEYPDEQMAQEAATGHLPTRLTSFTRPIRVGTG
jgi:hypothetical protein